MIDINELRQKISSVDIVDHVDIHANVKPVLTELLDRLESAESDALEQARLNGMGASREAALMAKLEAAEKSDAESIAMYRKARDERDTLRAKIEAMEKQEPAARTMGEIREWVSNGDGTYSLGGCLDALMPLPDGTSLYALPCAQPQLNEIKITLQRALELGQRETWTGARKHRSREDQREEQQCWNKVWNLLGAKGE